MKNGNINSDNFVRGIESEFSAMANKSNAKAMEKYMKGISKYFGIKAEERKSLSRKYINNNGLPQYNEIEFIIHECWESPYREMQYFAMELLLKYKKQWPAHAIKLIEYMIVTKSWWDTVDYIASNLAGTWFMKYPSEMDKITGMWNTSDNMWLIRSSIIFQLKYKADTNTALLFSYIREHTNSKEFFIKKAIGWSLRQLSKTDADAVKIFIRSTPLQPLSLKEASKYL
jgi:3-methyladenine DNA glycosylase AlkD